MRRAAVSPDTASDAVRQAGSRAVAFRCVMTLPRGRDLRAQPTDRSADHADHGSIADPSRWLIEAPLPLGILPLELPRHRFLSWVDLLGQR